jgi:hypothetical protein
MDLNPITLNQGPIPETEWVLCWKKGERTPILLWKSLGCLYHDWTLKHICDIKESDIVGWVKVEDLSISDDTGVTADDMYFAPVITSRDIG